MVHILSNLLFFSRGGGRGIGGSCEELLYFIILKLMHRNEQGFAAVLFSNKFQFGFYLYIAGAAT